MSQKSPTIQGYFRKRASYSGVLPTNRALHNRPCSQPPNNTSRYVTKEPYNIGLFPQKSPVLGFYPLKEKRAIDLAHSPRTTNPGMPQKCPTIQGSFRKRALYCGALSTKRALRNRRCSKQRPPVCCRSAPQYSTISAKEPYIMGFYPQIEPYIIDPAPSPRTTPPGMSQKSPTI